MMKSGKNLRRSSLDQKTQLTTESTSRREGGGICRVDDENNPAGISLNWGHYRIRVQKGEKLVMRGVTEGGTSSEAKLPPTGLCTTPGVGNRVIGHMRVGVFWVEGKTHPPRMNTMRALWIMQVGTGEWGSRSEAKKAGEGGRTTIVGGGIN